MAGPPQANRESNCRTRGMNWKRPNAQVYPQVGAGRMYAADHGVGCSRAAARTAPIVRAPVQYGFDYCTLRVSRNCPLSPFRCASTGRGSLSPLLQPHILSLHPIPRRGCFPEGVPEVWGRMQVGFAATQSYARGSPLCLREIRSAGTAQSKRVGQKSCAGQPRAAT